MSEFSFSAAPLIGSFRISDRPHVSSGAVNWSQRRSLVKPVNAEPQRQGSVVPHAATIVAPGAYLFFC